MKKSTLIFSDLSKKQLQQLKEVYIQKKVDSMNINQLKEFGLKFHTLRTGVKYGADLFVDDKGISDNNFFKDNGKGKKLEPWQLKDRD